MYFVGSDAWLQQCHVSVCPTGDLIVFGRERRLVVLTAKWDSSTGLNQFYTTYAGTLEENDIIKAVLCLPIVGQSQSSHVSLLLSLSVNNGLFPILLQSFKLLLLLTTSLSKFKEIIFYINKCSILLFCYKLFLQYCVYSFYFSFIFITRFSVKIRS